ncbi:hypothetical protein BUY77_08365 [Staphylococcus equorum]|nr:hypothetical protein BUY77_08365 [Staphylococcus equorum]PTF10391.1 hypothetical protein BUY81_10815 [Staphylococcus equorum]RIL45912.1 hypothetical protein BUY82_12790 [Staphylococcus equorum]
MLWENHKILRIVIVRFRRNKERGNYLDKNNFLTGSLGIYFVIDLYFGLKDHVKLSDLIM